MAEASTKDRTPKIMATRRNSKPPVDSEALAEATAYEQAIAAEAEQIRGEAPFLTPKLFSQLYLLLCRPIHPAHIQEVGVVTGKPYESVGVRSVQVQIDRMNNVLGPTGWEDFYTHS